MYHILISISTSLHVVHPCIALLITQLRTTARYADGQVANPDALTVLFDGDGSFNMTNMDLSTIKRPRAHDDGLRFACVHAGAFRTWR